MKVVILTSYTTANIYLVNYLTDRKDVIAKVIERTPLLSSYKEKMAVRKGLIKKFGLVKTMNKLIYNKYRSYFLDRKNREIIRQALFPEVLDLAYTKQVPTMGVENINESKCIDFISKYNPDIIAVCGTTILKPEVFQLSKRGTINIHCGITPEYRSAEPIFWALYNNEPDKVGVTIHFVDEGIDTGDIIYQEAVTIKKNDNLATLRCKCIKAGAVLMIKAIDDIERSRVKRIKKDIRGGKAYYHMDLGIWQYLIFKWQFSKLKKRLC
ncbi:MAG: formyl transferase [Thermodesulfobacteriota bacterium]|nr:formyl transferase [Thermodesulfobacteriota bacterium]